jgi:hypothetical protein
MYSSAQGFAHNPNVFGIRTLTITGENDDLRVSWLDEALQDHAALLDRSFGMSRLRQYRIPNLGYRGRGSGRSDPRSDREAAVRQDSSDAAPECLNEMNEITRHWRSSTRGGA